MESRIIWFTGLSGSGKSTIANALSGRVLGSVVLDGDVLRSGLCSDLAFSVQDRNENIRRAGEVAKILLDAGQSPICAFISPIRTQREWLRALVQDGSFIEVHVRCPLEVCAARDPKGLYKRALRGEIPQFTGISSPYEPPEKPEVVVDTDSLSVEECVAQVMDAAGFVDLSRPRHVFIGRWSPIHNGHMAIIKEVLLASPGPVLVLVRTTSFDEFSAQTRCRLVEAAMEEHGIAGEALIVPDVASINWGRGVGYARNCVEVPESVKSISATSIRESIAAGGGAWKSMMPSSSAALLERELEKRA